MSPSVPLPWRGGGLRVEDDIGSGACQWVPGQAGIAAEAAILHLSGPMEMEEDSWAGRDNGDILIVKQNLGWGRQPSDKSNESLPGPC